MEVLLKSKVSRLRLPHGTCAALAREINDELGEPRMTPKAVWEKIHKQEDPEMLRRVASYVERRMRAKTDATEQVRQALKAGA